EVTSVVRRLREADASRVVLVASGRTKATTSAVALRLLAQVAAEEGRELALVADPGARALAAEAGIAAFASVADANAEDAVPAAPPPAARAPIHVVRGAGEPAAPDQPAALAAAAAVPLASRLDETQSVPVQAAAPAAPAASPQAAAHPPTRAPVRPRRAARSVPRAALAAILVLLLMAGAAFATVLPGATVTIHPDPLAVGPESYSVRPPVQPSDTEPLSSTRQGEATGHRTRRTSATGVITLYNYSPVVVFVPQGTVVSADGVVLFATRQAVSVPDSAFFFAGTADVEVEAVEPGTAGNVPDQAINTVEDEEVDRQLRQGAPQNRRVRNFDPTVGGSETELNVVRRTDVQRVRNAINRDLESQLDDVLTADAERLYPTVEAPRAEIPVPDDLVGHVSEAPFTFELTGTMPVDRTFVFRADAEAEAEEAFLADEGALPANTELAPDTIEVDLGEASLDGESIVVQATVTADAVPDISDQELEALRQELTGLPASDARRAVASIGPATVDLWPGWVDRLPRLDWRITISVEAAEGGP
ncbi:MAG TPA: baseplate J/gp47 family protein, partial [Candidatus Limnocylindria bacterium]|nr:baseplate J/gp47 family protein [Candidatus Limnocylindria bacterium]